MNENQHLGKKEKNIIFIIIFRTGHLTPLVGQDALQNQSYV